MTTVNIVLVREHARRVKPPRALFVPFPFGFALGRPNDPALQHRVLAAALELLPLNDTPVLADFPEEETGPVRLVQASDVEPAPAPGPRSPADEVTALRAFYERWVADHQGRTAVGLSGVPQRQFRKVVRYLEAYALGEAADLEERGPALSVPQFLRYCIDDLKAFFYEARMAQRPGAVEEELHRWFWGETAMGQLIQEIGAKMSKSDDPALRLIAFGIAR